MSPIGKTCPKCGRFFLGNRCVCGYEVLPEIPKSMKRDRIIRPKK